MQTELNNEVMSLSSNWNSWCHVPGSHFKYPQNKGNGLSHVSSLSLPLPLSLCSPGDQMQNASFSFIASLAVLGGCILTSG